MSALDGFLIVQKVGARMPISVEMFGVRFGRTPDDEYELAVSVEQRRREAAEREQALAAFWTTLLDRTFWHQEWAVSAVLDLHAPDTEARSWLTCPVCDADELDPGPWPCRTVEAIATAYAIPTPKENT